MYNSKTMTMMRTIRSHLEVDIFRILDIFQEKDLKVIFAEGSWDIKRS